MNANLSFRIGFIVNPLAGVGGAAALKGSDAESIQCDARRGRLDLTSPSRAKTFVQSLLSCEKKIHILTVSGVMGETYLLDLGYSFDIVDCAISPETSAKDTKSAVVAVQEAGIDLLVFVGGDGTARDVCEVINRSQPVLGVPAGVKMHSGVFGVDPTASAEVVKTLAEGGLIDIAEQEVRDIDEDAFRQGIVKSRYYGEMLVPALGEFVQHVKQGGIEVDELVLLDISEEIKARCQELQESNCLYIFGPGSTTHFIISEMQEQGTLLGVDVMLNDNIIASDVSSKVLSDLLNEHDGEVRLIITAIGGQGHIIGRGNQQLSPEIIKSIGKHRIWIVATKTKLKNLNGRPLLIDSGDRALDIELTGYYPVVTGFRDSVLYAVGRNAVGWSEKNA